MSSLRCTTHHHACDCREEKFKDAENELKAAKQALSDIFEVWAGSEVCAPLTASEVIQQEIIEKMADIARDNK
ncbi:hypothetical protein [uncultured Paraglaciecola sp.]|uniref:hypothetical protein n=1 Tax=uncultured Paraglaciecola sp. TaxID=1765024 RepID=UPI00262BBAEC|nr:hypothetical protein [uncultured Paraglaciecola sp.]